MGGHADGGRNGSDGSGSRSSAPLLGWEAEKAPGWHVQITIVVAKENDGRPRLSKGSADGATWTLDFAVENEMMSGPPTSSALLCLRASTPRWRLDFAPTKHVWPVRLGLFPGHSGCSFSPPLFLRPNRATTFFFTHPSNPTRPFSGRRKNRGCARCRYARGCPPASALSPHTYLGTFKGPRPCLCDPGSGATPRLGISHSLQALHRNEGSGADPHNGQGCQGACFETRPQHTLESCDPDPDLGTCSGCQTGQPTD